MHWYKLICYSTFLLYNPHCLIHRFYSNFKHYSNIALISNAFIPFLPTAESISGLFLVAMVSEWLIILFLTMTFDE